MLQVGHSRGRQQQRRTFQQKSSESESVRTEAEDRLVTQWDTHMGERQTGKGQAAPGAPHVTHPPPPPCRET